MSGTSQQSALAARWTIVKRTPWHAACCGSSLVANRNPFDILHRQVQRLPMLEPVVDGGKARVRREMSEHLGFAPKPVVRICSVRSSGSVPFRKLEDTAPLVFEIDRQVDRATRRAGQDGEDQIASVDQGGPAVARARRRRTRTGPAPSPALGTPPGGGPG
jgi:hypothetical protein